MKNARWKIALTVFALLTISVRGFNQNLIYDGDFNLSGAGWSTSCVNIEAWGFETTYGGPSSTNHVAEIDDQACMHQDVCILPGLSYTLSVDASCRTAGGPNPCISHINVFGLDASGSIVSTFVSMNYTRTNTTFALTPVTGIPTINVPPCSGIVKLRVEFVDSTPGYLTLGMIIDNVSLISTSTLIVAGPDTACANSLTTLTIPGAAPCLTYNWSFSGGAPSSSTSASPAVSWSSTGSHPVSVVIGNGLCDVYTLNFSVFIKAAIHNTIVASVCSGTPYYFGGVPIFTPGTYTDSVSIPGGCDSVTTLILTVTPRPSPPGVADINYCQFDVDAPLTASGSPLLWYGPGVAGPSATAPTPPTTMPGTFTYFVTQGVTGCSSDSAKIVVTVKPKPGPPVTHSATYCMNSPAATLSATGSGTFLWYTTGTGGISITPAPQPSTLHAGTTTWYVSQVVDGCESDRARESVTVLAPPMFTINTSHTDVCENDTVSLSYNGNAAIGLTWNIPADALIEEGGLNSASLLLHFNTTGARYVSLTAYDTSGMCSSTDSIRLNVVPQPWAHMYTKNDVCLGDTIALSLITRSDNADSFKWFIDSSPLFQSPDVIIISANANSGGPYRLAWSNAGPHTITMYTLTREGCRSVNVVDSVKVNVPPDASFMADDQKTICLGDSVYFKAAIADRNNTYEWEPAGFFNETNQPFIWGRMLAENSTVTLTVTNAYGCKATSNQVIDVKSCCAVAMPNAFVPARETYRPIMTGHHLFHRLVIANRWGQIVFETSNSEDRWDGTFNGVPQDMDTYYYYLQYDCDGKTLFQKGDITLIR